MKSRLGRSGAKETVLAYVDATGRRRDSGELAEAGHVGEAGIVSHGACAGGLAAIDAFARRRGIDSDIVWPVERQQAIRREGFDVGRLSQREGLPE